MKDDGPPGSGEISGMRPVLIGGCDRSGTTLLGAMLGGHSDCLCVPESQFLVDLLGNSATNTPSDFDLAEILKALAQHPRFNLWGVELDAPAALSKEIGLYAQLVEWIVRQYGVMHGKPNPLVWIDHTPWNTKYAATLFNLFPGAKMIHIVRDGRAVAASIMPLSWGPKTVDQAAYFWLRNLSYGLAAEIRYPDHVIRVRYEDLVSDPAGTLEGLCGFIGIDYQPGMAQAGGFQVPPFTRKHHALIGQLPDTGRIDAWQNNLADRQIEIFESITGDMLSYLGYTPRFDAHKRGMNAREKIFSVFGVTRMYAGHLVQRVRLHRSGRNAAANPKN